ncbi:unnamed protein product [Ambrosiozyma monospora]|uniref:Unnamed protein product n=1 Tax=Ambrosiozyma monospora TaxID=43982 RepID=A0ACB5T4X5_AMBMO|nr:unnamed protein product [Ambrosiozyma monospora]
MYDMISNCNKNGGLGYLDLENSLLGMNIRGIVVQDSRNVKRKKVSSMAIYSCRDQICDRETDRIPTRGFILDSRQLEDPDIDGSVSNLKLQSAIILNQQNT